MFSPDSEQRTLPASPRRRAMARQSGSVSRSPDAAATLVLIAFTFGLLLVGPSVFVAACELLTNSFTTVRTDASDGELLESTYASSGLYRSVTWWLLAAVAAAIVGNMLQFGLLFAPAVIQADPQRLNPRTGLQSMLSGLHMPALLLRLIRLATIAALTGGVVWSFWPRLSDPTRIGPEVAAATFCEAVIVLAVSLAGGVVIVSLLLAAVARIRHEAALRMTPQEVREERQMDETDPSIVQRRRVVRQQTAHPTTSVAPTRHT